MISSARPLTTGIIMYDRLKTFWLRNTAIKIGKHFFDRKNLSNARLLLPNICKCLLGEWEQSPNGRTWLSNENRGSNRFGLPNENSPDPNMPNALTGCIRKYHERNAAQQTDLHTGKVTIQEVHSKYIEEFLYWGNSKDDRLWSGWMGEVFLCWDYWDRLRRYEAFLKCDYRHYWQRGYQGRPRVWWISSVDVYWRGSLASQGLNVLRWSAWTEALVIILDSS